MRKYYLDNIRWMTIVTVVIYHVLYMYNGESILGGLGKIKTLEEIALGQEAVAQIHGLVDTSDIHHQRPHRIVMDLSRKSPRFVDQRLGFLSLTCEHTGRGHIECSESLLPLVTGLQGLAV